MQIQCERVNKLFYESLEDFLYVVNNEGQSVIISTVTNFQILDNKENIVSKTGKKY